MQRLIGQPFNETIFNCLKFIINSTKIVYKGLSQTSHSPRAGRGSSGSGGTVGLLNLRTRTSRLRLQVIIWWHIPGQNVHFRLRGNTSFPDMAAAYL